MNDRQAVELRIGGTVQGVGFRPFVYRLATALGLAGWIRNESGCVRIHVEGHSEAIARFAADVIAEAPAAAEPTLRARKPVPVGHLSGFTIRSSTGSDTTEIRVPADLFVCDDCLAEMADPEARRHRYPFINCTQCGPRYTLITEMPYDRPNTSMAPFALCAACRREYGEPADRRFHAQPLACPDCGPALHFARGEETASGEAAFAAALHQLRAGGIVAVKGIGGYHLLCDATCNETVLRLRTRKPRPDKPLAVLYPDLDRLQRDLEPGEVERALLTSPRRPIILCRHAPASTLAPAIAPGLREVGAMLPYSPLHHLLAHEFGGPLVATSGNRGGEPVITAAAAAEDQLQPVADAFLHHNRPIVRPADDSVIRTVRNRATLLRTGRGFAPLELPLPRPLQQPVVALGGQMKNSIALGFGDRAVLSPHIGDLTRPRGLALFAATIADLQRFYGVTARRHICDAHPGYAGSRWAREQTLPSTAVLHHHAHASALHGEHAGTGEWLVFTWDGVGYGADGTLWGGEALIGQPGRWRRVGTLRRFHLPGGEKAAREPWRSALALCWESGIAPPPALESPALLQQAWVRRINAPATSAAGRLFDGAAALLGLVTHASYEGQGPMQLEAMARPGEQFVPLPMHEEEALLTLDWAPLLPMLLDGSLSQQERASRFHASLARAIRAQALRVRETHRFSAVGLTGGVFQNRLLAESTACLLEAEGFTVHLSHAVPGNDGGLAYGQLIEWAACEEGARPFFH